MKKYKVAIIGASGLVGQKIIQVLIEEKLIEKMQITLYVSEKSVGKSLNIGKYYFKYQLLDNNILNEKFNIAFFSAGESISKIWAEKLSKAGCYIIDNTNAFRKEPYIPLVVPEINIDKINYNTKIIANPNCSTIQLAIIIDRLLKLQKIKTIIVSTYQSVSGAGKDALKDLEKDTNFYFKEGIKNNLILKIGEIDDNNFCQEENKIMFELNKILNSNINIYASAVRVPIPYCHTESVYVKFSKKINIDKLLNSLKVPYIKIDNDISIPLKIADTNLTHICRIRKASNCELLFFIVADNLRRGAAYNAVKIAEHIINNFL